MRSAVKVLLHPQSPALEQGKQAAIMVGASLLVALCAHVSYRLPGNPIPFTLQNFAVVLIGLRLGSRRGFATLALYLAEGAAGLPVFNPYGPGGIAQLLGPTGGYLMAYPLAAGLAGLIFERGRPSFTRALSAAVAGEILLFAGGIFWLRLLTHSLRQAVWLGLYWFIFAEIIKILLAAAISVRLRSNTKA